MTGIYIITNKVNKNSYIGKAKNIQNRFDRHLKSLRTDKHYNKHLQNSFNKYGETNFVFDVLEQCCEEELNDREKYWIKYYRENNICYLFNITDGGDGGKMPDYILESTRKKISQKARGSEYVKHFGSENGMYGRHHTKQSKELMSKNRSGTSSWNKNKHWSEDVKKKISESNRGKTHTLESRLKISKALRGKTKILSRNVWSNELCSVCRLLHLFGYSYIKLGKLLNTNSENVRYSIRRYEKENNLYNSSTKLLLLND